MLENAKNDLLEKLKAQEEEASSAASQFQVQVAALEARNHELSRTVDDASERMESSIRSLDDSDVALHAKQAELDAARRALAEASQTISQNEVASQGMFVFVVSCGMYQRHLMISIFVTRRSNQGA